VWRDRPAIGAAQTRTDEVVLAMVDVTFTSRRHLARRRGRFLRHLRRVLQRRSLPKSDAASERPPLTFVGGRGDPQFKALQLVGADVNEPNPPPIVALHRLDVGPFAIYKSAVGN